MKKRILILFLCFIMLFITSCSNETVVPANTSTTENTTEELTFDLDKIRFCWDDIGDDMDDHVRERIEDVGRYFVDEQGNGGCKTQMSMMAALYVYMDEYSSYKCRIKYNNLFEFDENMLGDMLGDMLEKNTDECYYLLSGGLENFDIDIIKSLSSNYKIDSIVFYPPYVVHPAYVVYPES